MAFGDIKGTKTGTLTSITASFPCSTGTNFAVVVGDLIVAACAEQSAKTVTACADNLGNTYTAIGAGADAGTVTGRAFYSRVTVAGTISSVTFTATASANNCVGLAVGFEGPFATSPLDAAPTAIVNDNTTPYTCPATGTLAQTSEKIVNLIVHNANPTLTATAPNLKAVEQVTATVLRAALGHQTVTSTASVTPAWTSSGTPTTSGYGTASFKRAIIHYTMTAETGTVAASGQAATLTYAGGGPPEPLFRSSSSTSYASTTNTTLTVPTGTANNDVLIAHIIALKASSGPTISPPAGWAQIGSTIHIADLSDNWLTVGTYWKRAASESGSYVFTVDGGTARSQQGQVSAYSDCTTTGSPVHMFSEASGTINTTDTTIGGAGVSAIAPAITTTQAGCMLVNCVTAWDATARSPTSSWTERLDIEHLYLQDLLQTSAGATGSITVTANSGTAPWTTTLIALLPAGAVGEPEPGLVQKNGGTVRTNASIATSLPAATTAGNTILIFANGAGTITTPSGFVSRSPQVGAQGCYLFEKMVASGNASDTPTLVMAGAYNATWQIAEYRYLTAFDTSAGYVSGIEPEGPWDTEAITPAIGNKRLVAFIVSTVASGHTVTAGDPQGWTNGFTGQQSNQINYGPATGEDSMAGGFADGLVAADGRQYSTTATIINAVGTTILPASIIAAYTTTETPPPNYAPAYRSQSTLNYAGGRTDTVLTAPPGIVDGDILLLTHLVGGPSPPTTTLPAGFNLIDTTTVAQNGGGFTVITKVAWKRAASESGSYTITHSSASSSGALMVYSGCIASGSPIDAYSKAFISNPVSDGDGRVATAPSITTTVADTRLVYTGHDWDATGALLPPGGFVERFDNLIYVADTQNAAVGATGPVGHNTGVGSPYSAPWAAYLIALKPVPPAAGGAYTLTAGTGTLTLSGQAMTPRVAMPVVNGTLTASGQAVALRVTRKMAAATGTLTLAGQTMTPRVAMPIVNGTLTFAGQTVVLRYGHKAPAEVGVLTLGGQPVTLKRTYVMPAGIGTLTFAGQASFLRYTRLKLTALAGTLTLSGQTVVPRATRKMPVTAGTLTLSGWPTTHRWTHVIAAGTGTLTLSGWPINLTYSGSGAKALLATPGFLAAAGQPVTLRYKRVFPAGTGTLALAGQTAALRAVRRMALLQGALTLSGRVVVTRYGYVRTAGTGTLTAAGQPVALRIGRRLPAINGTLTLAGRPVNLDYLGKVHYMLSAAPGSMVMAGQPVILRRARVMPAAAGTLTLAGQSIGFKYGHALAAETGSLDLSGQAATLFYQQRFVYGIVAEVGTLRLIGSDAGLGYAPISPEIPPQILARPVPRVRALTGKERARSLKYPIPHARELVSRDGRWRTFDNDGRRIRTLNPPERV